MKDIGLHDQSFSVSRMMPPGPVKYYFSVNGINGLDEFAPTIDTMKHQKEYDNLIKKTATFIGNPNPRDDEKFTDKVIEAEK